MNWTELLKKHKIALEALKGAIEVQIKAVENGFTGSIEITFTQGRVAGKWLHNKVK